MTQAPTEELKLKEDCYYKITLISDPNLKKNLLLWGDSKTNKLTTKENDPKYVDLNTYFYVEKDLRSKDLCYSIRLGDTDKFVELKDIKNNNYSLNDEFEEDSDDDSETNNETIQRFKIYLKKKPDEEEANNAYVVQIINCKNKKPLLNSLICIMSSCGKTLPKSSGPVEDKNSKFVNLDFVDNLMNWAGKFLTKSN